MNTCVKRTITCASTWSVRVVDQLAVNVNVNVNVIVIVLINVIMVTCVKRTITCASIWSVRVVYQLAVIQNVVEQPSIVVTVLDKVSPAAEKNLQYKAQSVVALLNGYKSPTCLQMRRGFPSDPVSPPFL